MKKIVIALSTIVALAILIFAEYRYIMCNQIPSWGDDGFLHIEFMGQVNTYYIEGEYNHN